MLFISFSESCSFHCTPRAISCDHKSTEKDRYNSFFSTFYSPMSSGQSSTDIKSGKNLFDFWKYGPRLRWSSCKDSQSQWVVIKYIKIIATKQSWYAPKQKQDVMRQNKKVVAHNKYALVESVEDPLTFYLSGYWSHCWLGPAGSGNRRRLI